MWIVFIILVLLLCVSLYFLVRFSLHLLRIQDAIEESLDIMDERYTSISKVLEIPLFYDSPEVRKVLKDIAGCRNSILYIANVLTGEEIPGIEEGDDMSE